MSALKKNTDMDITVEHRRDSAAPSPVTRLDGYDNFIVSDIWSRRYLAEGHIWGDEASQTAEMLVDHLQHPSRILEIGFGYGRDLTRLLQEGHNVTGVEKAAIGLAEATRQIQQYMDHGRAHLTLGDFTTTDPRPGGVDAVLSHRVLHLLGQNGLVSAFVNKTAAALKPGGLLFVSARDHRDFNPEQMNRHDDGTITYREDVKKLGDRRGQLISLWDQARFEEAFSKKFDFIGFEQGNEPESINNVDADGKPVQTFYTIMKARKKFEGPQNR